MIFFCYSKKKDISLPYLLDNICSMTAVIFISPFSIFERWLCDMMPSRCKSICFKPNSLRTWYSFEASLRFSFDKSFVFIGQKYKVKLYIPFWNISE